MSGGRLRLDPVGEMGLPVWGWNSAPDGLATREQLRRQGLRPKRGAEVVGLVRWYSRKARAAGGVREANLYRITETEPIGEYTQARARGLEAAMRARRTCPTCRTEQPYYLSTRLGECTSCAYGLSAAA